MESEQPPKKLAPAEYAEMVKMKLRNTYPNCLNPMRCVHFSTDFSFSFFHFKMFVYFFVKFSERVIDSLNNLLAKSAVKLKNEQLEEQFKADLINKQLKAFDDLWQNLGLTESLTELKKRMQDRPKSSALKRCRFLKEILKKIVRKLKSVIYNSIAVCQVVTMFTNKFSRIE